MSLYARCRSVLIAGLFLALLPACASPHQPDRLPTLTATLTSTAHPTVTQVVLTPKISTPTLPLRLTSTATPAPTPTINATPSQACQEPPDDYRRVTIGKAIINARTLWMLQLAQVLYQGRGDPLNITQGSYVNTEPASFGTHAGGGAVDISVRVKNNPSLLLTRAEMDDLVNALRHAGFAAWVRLSGDLNPPVALHIHAIAIGDRELSEPARRQIDGPEGYLRGLNGVPPDQGGTQPDRHGGPIVCAWMVALGYHDMR